MANIDDGLFLEPAEPFHRIYYGPHRVEVTFEFKPDGFFGDGTRELPAPLPPPPPPDMTVRRPQRRKKR